MTGLRKLWEALTKIKINQTFTCATSKSAYKTYFFYILKLFSVGHKGKFGHEFLEFEFKPNGRLRYANNSQYKADSFLGKEVFVSNIILEELKRIVHQSGILNKSDNNWP